MADVIVALNLMEGDSRAAHHRQRRLEAACSTRLPVCLGTRGERDLLQVTGTAAIDRSRCPPACGLELCPYPARSEPTFRGELPEAFCRYQASFYRRESAQMARFWATMEERVRS